MGTSVFYNGVELRNCWTKEFDQTPVRDPSDTDQYYHKFVITVECVANAQLLAEANPNLGILGNGIAAATAGLVAQAARKKLEIDRCEFVYMMEGVAIVQSNTHIDANNGPKVKAIRIVGISQNTLKIHFSIEVCLTDCSSTPFPVINNRWSCIDDINELWQITRTWRGSLRVGRVVNNPHSFRGMCVPRLQRGWRRTTMRFGGSPDGLSIDYEIVDKQMIGEAPPDPSVKMSITHTESMQQAGAFNIGELTVRLEGTRLSDKRLMLQRCMQVIVAKLQINVFKDDSGIFKQLILVDYSGEDQNVIEARAQVMRTLPAPAEGQSPADSIGATVIKNFGKTLKSLGMPNYDPNVAVGGGPYGLPPFSLAGLFVCYLQSPCVAIHGMPQIDDVHPDETDATEGNEEPEEITYTTQLYGFMNYPSQNSDHHLHMYTHARIESILKASQNRVQLPIASNAAPGEDTSITVNLAPRTSKRVLRYSAERVGDWPVLWTPEDFTDANGIEYKFLEWYPNIRAPESQSDGRMLYTVDAEYEFSMNRAPKTGENIATVAMPWDNFKPTDNTHVFTPRSLTSLTGPKGAN